MTRSEYVKIHAVELDKICKKMEKLREKPYSGKVSAEINRLGMYKEMESERIGYALGYLGADDVKQSYFPAAGMEYKGIREELEKLKFE